ncbi:MAG TPA: FG-GAP repeat protein [Thermoanaerobaculia bacterium]|nr:FG-GAP repeat protein [Thermoanaerobaculia bacterium]
MEHVNRTSAAHKKFSHGITSLAIVVAVAVLVSTAAVGPAHAQSTGIQQSQRILQPSGETAEHDSFGTGVAISGNGKTMIIGAFNADGNEVGAGAAFIFDRIEDNWVQTAKLFAADGQAEPVPSPPFPPNDFRTDAFGSTVAISEDGNTVIAGAPGHKHKGLAADSGAVYVYQRVNGSWSQQAELFSPTPNSQDHFGEAPDFGGVGISGNTIVVTDEGNGFSSPGAVDVFTRTNDTWTLSTRLFVPDDPFFLPSSLAFDGRTLVVGSDISDAPTASLAGVVYVFRLDDGQWSAPVALTAADASSGGTFGFSVGLSNNTIGVGASLGPGATSQSGAAYVFVRHGDAWIQRARLIADDGADGDNFGTSISVSDQRVLVGATGHTPPAGAFGAGAGYVFQPRGGTWAQIAELSASDGITGGNFGGSVAVQNGTLLIGAFGQHPPVEGYPGGEAYVYQLRDN